ncbi:MAG: hypothetical protein C4320_01010 [Armatimonadota bacterium]
MIVPMGRDEEARLLTLSHAERLAEEMRARGLRVKVDAREKESPGFKYNHWEMRGVPVRVELGPRDLEVGTAILARRHDGEKETTPLDAVVNRCVELQEEIQKALYDRALAFREANTHRVDTWDEFVAAFPGEGGGGFVLAHWDGTQETEDLIGAETKTSIRCLPLEALAPEDNEPGVCVKSGRPSPRRVLFARAY